MDLKSRKMDPIEKILQQAKTIAVVGLSSNPARPSFQVAEYLQRQGYQIIPVNPNEREVIGNPSYQDLDAVQESVDIVDIFRRPEFVPGVVQQAIRKKVKLIWMQPGAENWEAADAAEAAGIKAVVGMCLRTAHRTQAN